MSNLSSSAFAALVLLGPFTGTGSAQDTLAPTSPVEFSYGDGLHGYIGYSASRPDERAEYGYGMGFYSAVWSLIESPLHGFQIGLASAWITPDNSDNRDTPLAPVGTLARDNWPERGPTWGSVFQTVEGGLGYWRGNRFRYGPPKFSMNATPQCYDYEVGSPGWSFFYDTEALPDDRLGIAQLSNRLLIPPDALPFEGQPDGDFLGYTYMALPFMAPKPGDPAKGVAPTGDQAWTCFLAAANFKGPIAYYVPETWSKIGTLFEEPFIFGRGLDARAGEMGGGAMEINTVPRASAVAADGTRYSKIPRLVFPIDERGDAVLVQDVIYYSRTALFDAFEAWRDGGPACDGTFDPKGAWRATLTTRTPGFDQGGKRLRGVDGVFDTQVFDDGTWGLRWNGGDSGDSGSGDTVGDDAIDSSERGLFPQYYRHDGDERVAVRASDVPIETGLLDYAFPLAESGEPFTSPFTGSVPGAWTEPGPIAGARGGPHQVRLGDGSLVTYSWYRFVDQPTFQQYRGLDGWGAAEREQLQAFVEKIHRDWPIDRDFMAPPSRGELVSLDPALLVTPPVGLEVGYVPIVTRQEAAPVGGTDEADE
jgi:hypothetical protein